MYGYRGPLVAVGVVTTVLGLIAISLRAYLWLSQRRKQGLDDIFMWLAWVSTGLFLLGIESPITLGYSKMFSIGFMITSFTSLRYGIGLQHSQFKPSQGATKIQIIYAEEIFYYLCVYCIKMSLMFLYFRIANATRSRFWLATVCMTVLLTLQFISTIVLVGIQCRPLKKYWDPTTPGLCLDVPAFFYSTNAFTIFSDCIILVLPIPTVWSVQRPRGEKLAIIGAFLLGAVSTLMACVRIYFIRITPFSIDPKLDIAPINLWSFIEINLGILCGSGPVIKAIITKATKVTHTEEWKLVDMGAISQARYSVRTEQSNALACATVECSKAQVHSVEQV